MGGVGRAWGVGLRLQGAQFPVAHSPAQALATHPVPVFTQSDLQSAGAITALEDAGGR